MCQHKAQVYVFGGGVYFSLLTLLHITCMQILFSSWQLVLGYLTNSVGIWVSKVWMLLVPKPHDFYLLKYSLSTQEMKMMVVMKTAFEMWFSYLDLRDFLKS